MIQIQNITPIDPRRTQERPRFQSRVLLYAPFLRSVLDPWRTSLFRRREVECANKSRKSLPPGVRVFRRPTSPPPAAAMSPALRRLGHPRQGERSLRDGSLFIDLLKRHQRRPSTLALKIARNPQQNSRSRQNSSIPLNFLSRQSRASA
jgi:hypothetical protein